MTNDLARKRRAERCTTHSHACDCREYEHAQEIARKDAEIAELRARAERAEGRIADAPAVKAMCADLLTRLQRLSGENPVARVILLPEDWPEIEELIASVNKIAQHEKEPT